jgi:hypothetical protein
MQRIRQLRHRKLGRRASFPIYQDIRIHIMSHTLSGDAHLTPSDKFRAALNEHFAMRQGRDRPQQP